MEIRARASASMRLDMSRPVLITHLAPRVWRLPMRVSTDLGIGGFSNSANKVPSKSVEISLIVKLMFSCCVYRQTDTCASILEATGWEQHAPRALALTVLRALACRNETLWTFRNNMT